MFEMVVICCKGGDNVIITITLNPAMDKVLILKDFSLNITNRIQEQFTCVGGKGTHISINLSLLGIRSTAIGVVMGDTGEKILHSLKSMDIDVQFIKLAEGESRTNYVVVDDEGNCTLIAEKGQLMSQQVIDQLLFLYASKVGKYDIVVISGDASNQSNTNLQDTIMDIAAQKGARVCIDASGEHLKAAINKRPFLIKPNMDELSKLLDRSIKTEKEILAAIKELYQQYGIANIMVSCGEDGSYFCSEGAFYRIIAPKIQAKNTVGCGDAVVSGLLAGIEERLPIELCLKRASAIAAATAMDKSTVGFDISILDELAQRVIVQPIPL